MSQRELASQLGRATHTPFYRWMELKAEPPPAEVFNIERVLDVPPGMLSIRLGYLPPEARGTTPPSTSFEDAIKADPELNDQARRVLRVVYSELTRKPGKRAAR